jgi:MYXO-CTERM domain-containing protein
MARRLRKVATIMRLSRAFPLFFAVVGAVSWSTHARAADSRLESLPVRTIDLCPTEADGSRRCDVKIRTDQDGVPIYANIESGPVGGYAPADIESAYGLPVGGGAGKLVVLYGGNSDYPQAESDLGVYRAQYGLPPCTTANGCFMKVDEHGGTDYPAAGSSEVEQALDMEMVSASCPACKVMLIEGGDLGVALATVLAKGASAFSFSVLLGFGGSTGSQCDSLGFNADSGLLITAALGDTKYPGARDYMPAACQGTLAVGGTSLTMASGSARGWAETTWSGTGSGCSPYVAKPSWQTDTGCTMRMEGDVAMVADPGTGVSVYNTLGASGWFVVGGTSAAAPLTAGSLTALGIANGKFSPAWIWQNPVDFYDITTGSNGPCTGVPDYFCNAGAGYDGPTGWGTVNGNLLKTALPPGSAAGGACAVPTGNYTASCTDCAAMNRTTGCTLVCESCSKVDGSQNPGPTLGLPCTGTVMNDDGSLQCFGAIVDAGADSGQGDAATGPSHDGGVARDAGVAPSLDAGGLADGSPTEINADTPAGSNSGCGCSTTASSSSPGSLALGLVFLWGLRRRRTSRARR